MTENIFGNTDWVDESEAIRVLPPTLQWRRGDKVNAEPFLKFGCWQLPKENWPMKLGQPWKEADCQHNNDIVIPSYITGKIHIAVIAWRKSWFVADGDKRQYVQGFTEGARSTMKYWALVKELDNEPVILTTSGLNAMNLENAIRAFAKQVIAPAGRLAGKRFSYYHFWIPLKTQGAKPTKQGQYITPPGLDLPKVDTEVMRSLFVGKDIAEFATDFVGEAKEWANYAPQQEPEQSANSPEPFDHEEPPFDPNQVPPSMEEVEEIPW